MTVRTRFAPSPTGYLHVGGVRTMLFNWLFARRHDGTFILRIDDTDAARNKVEALQPILDGFDWLGLNWDEGPTQDGSGDSFGPHKPYFQGQRHQLYIDAAMKLVEQGLAYPDYTPAEEQDILRSAAEKAKRSYVHRGSNRDVDPAENLRLYKKKPAPILLKVPDGEVIEIHDHIRGLVKVNTDTVRDPALLRAADANGHVHALYPFATVVDEIAFGITHVIRAEEHLSNTPSQVLFFRALGATVPEFAHIPLVNFKNKKMSKRNLPPLTDDETAKLKACGWTNDELAERDDLNIATVAYYRELGYIPEALVNYLVRLGWSLDDSSEFIELETIRTNFSLDRVTKASANFDPQKLYWLQGEYMKRLSTDGKLTQALPFLRKAGFVDGEPTPELKERLTAIIDAAGDRIKLFSDVLSFARPFLNAEMDFDPKAIEKTFKPEDAKDLLSGFRDVLKTVEPFDAATIEQSLHDYINEKGVKPKVLVAATRVATTGSMVGFSLYDTLALLGRDVVVQRIDSTLTHSETNR